MFEEGFMFNKASSLIKREFNMSNCFLRFKSASKRLRARDLPKIRNYTHYLLSNAQNQSLHQALRPHRQVQLSDTEYPSSDPLQVSYSPSPTLPCNRRIQSYRPAASFPRNCVSVRAWSMEGRMEGRMRGECGK